MVLGCLLVASWQALCSFDVVSDFFLPAPGDLAARFWSDLNHGGLLAATGQTLAEAASGSGLALGVALPMGYLIAHSPLCAAALEPYLAASQAVPAVATAPLLALWIGYGMMPIAVLCALLVFFPIVMNTVLGLRTLPPDVVDAARVDGVGRWGLLWHIEAPLCLPALLTGARTGLTLSITGAVVGEFVMGGDGLGQLLSVQRGNVDTLGLFSTLLTLALLAMALYGVLALVERRLLR